MFDIRHHIWNVFELSKEQKVDNLYEALEMFLLNVELGRPRYKGATQVDYFDLMKKVCKTPINKRRDQKEIFNACMERNNNALIKAWKEQNRESFEEICLNDLIFYRMKK